MLNGPFSPWPAFTQEEAEAVTKVLMSNRVNYWTGEECRKFEEEFSDYVGTQDSISLANGTIALEIALKALGIGCGDEVVVTSRTFFASAASIVNVGAKPIFADIDDTTQNINIDTIQTVLTKNTKVILCVHLAGWPCDMEQILELASRENLFVVEDCAQAHGAKYKGRSVGSFGHIGCWSFCQDKIISTGGEGGMVTTNDDKLWKTMWSLKDHGKSLENIQNSPAKFGFKWLHSSFGTNGRMTEMQATIGRIQLKKLPFWNRTRLSIATRIWAAANESKSLYAPQLRCSGCKGLCSKDKGCVHAAYKCYVFVKKHCGNRDKILSEINKKGVPCFTGSCPEVYLEEAFSLAQNASQKRLRIAKQTGQSSLMFLCHPTLTEAEVSKTCAVIREF